MNLKFHTYALALKHPFTISRSSRTVQRTVIVELIEDGLSGFGEVTQNPYYGVTLDSVTERLEATVAHVAPLRLSTPEALWPQLESFLADAPFVLAALDAAAYDLWGHKHNQSVQALWHVEPGPMPVSSFTLGIDTAEIMVKKLAECNDWPLYKIKLGTPDDLSLLAALRDHTKAPFCADANAGWSLKQAQALLPRLPGFDVEFLEQPLAAHAWEAMTQLRPTAALPLIADESCRSLDDVALCVGRFHGINIKLAKCGGLTPARRMIDAARAVGLKVMVGCMVESTVGISAAAQLLPWCDYADLDGAVLLAEDTVRDGVRVVRGVAQFPAGAGLGVSLL